MFSLSFHRGNRSPRWELPHFLPPAPVNQLALVPILCSFFWHNGSDVPSPRKGNSLPLAVDSNLLRSSMLPDYPPFQSLIWIPNGFFFSLSSKYALVTLIFYMVIFFSFPLLHTQTSWKSCTQSLFVLIQHLVTHQPPPTGFLPYFSIKTIFTKVSSDLLAAKSYAYSSVFILCSLPVDFNKINPLFFPRETIFLVSKLPCSFDFFFSPLWLYFCLFAKLSSLTWPLNVETAQVQP